MARANEGSLTLSQEFDNNLKIFNEIENSSLPTNEDSLQKKINNCKKKLEKMTLMVSCLGLFSTNEILHEISSESIKFMLLPALLGCLTIKKIDLHRDEILNMSIVYFDDFIKRCKDYEITDIEIPQRQNDDEQSDSKCVVPKSKNTMPSPEEIKFLGQKREQKIKRFREKKEIADKLSVLKETASFKDEETMREFYLTLINYYIYVSLDELDSILMEQDMLKQMKVRPIPEKKVEKKIPFRPFLITKDQVQKKIYGPGYPSLPLLSVDEFYEMAIKEGRFGNFGTTAATGPDPAEDEAVEEQENLHQLRQRDEWRDDHRTGWGNTYNRS